jgi:hypothetical protein
MLVLALALVPVVSVAAVRWCAPGSLWCRSSRRGMRSRCRPSPCSWPAHRGGSCRPGRRTAVAKAAQAVGWCCRPGQQRDTQASERVGGGGRGGRRPGLVALTWSHQVRGSGLGAGAGVELELPGQVVPQGRHCQYLRAGGGGPIRRS